MAEIKRQRVIRPSTRKDSSVNYKVNVDGVSKDDILLVEITHESKPFRQCFSFEGKDLLGKKSIHFQVVEHPSIRIIWKGVKTLVAETLDRRYMITQKNKISELKSELKSPSLLKTSLPPIEDSNTKILILGTMPGEQSLKTQQYYANPRNRFWNIISVIIGKELPSNYQDRKIFLLDSGIGLWDVMHTAIRKSSLDSDIVKGLPNDIDEFVSKHKKLKVIAFNGDTAERFFNTYFSRKSNIQYISLPSSSSSNTHTDKLQISTLWRRLLNEA